MATFPYRAACLPALLCLGADAEAASWEMSAAAGAGLLWVGALATLCCVLLRRCHASERRLRASVQALQVAQRARVEAELALSELHDAMAELVQRQGKVRDDERGRIARDMHDDLGQSLLAARIDVSLLQVATRTLHPAVHAKLLDLGRTLESSLRALRGAINDLRPLALGEDLDSALRRQAREFARISGIVCEYAADDTALAAVQREALLDVVLYRIVQEALSNASRHSHASLVRVSLHRHDGGVTLTIHDDGIGMDADAARNGSGLSGMRERISAAGGQLLLDSGPESGTLLEVTLPLAHESVVHPANPC